MEPGVQTNVIAIMPMESPMIARTNRGELQENIGWPLILGLAPYPSEDMRSVNLPVLPAETLKESTAWCTIEGFAID